MKLDPLSIPYRALEQGARTIVGILFAGIASAGSVGGTEGLAIFVVVVVLGIGLALGYQIAYYRRFEYRLTEDTFDIDSGVFSRREREIPYGRIQNVDIAQNVFQRLFGIAEVRLETAGGGESEAQLQYVGLDEAQRLQESVSKRKRGVGEDAEAPERDQTLLFDITPRELVVLGVVSMDPRLLSILAVPLSFVGPSVIASYIPETDLLWLLVPLGLAAIVVVSALVSGVLAMTRYYGFMLWATEDEYRYERGLLQRFSGSIPKSKVQTVTITENVLARWLGYASLAIETAGSVASNNDSDSGSQSAIPMARRDRVVELAGQIEPFEELSFERPPKRARERYAARYAIAVTLVVGIGYVAARLTSFEGPWFLLAGLYLLVPVAAHLKWANLGYRVEDDHVVTRAGFWSRKTAIVPAYRIQTVVSAATVFQRRRDLATVVVDTAGGRRLTGGDAKIHDIDGELAAELREALADDLQTALARSRDQRRGRERADTPV